MLCREPRTRRLQWLLQPGRLAQVGIEAGLEYERYAAAIVVSSQDRVEGMTAFVEKRKPVFKGV